MQALFSALKSLAAIFLLSSSLTTPAGAADLEGNFSIKGVGQLKCGQLVELLKAKDPNIAQVVGWLDGYVTALNQLEPLTFDYAPWQSGSFLLVSLGKHCIPTPDQPLMVAITAMSKALYDNRLKVGQESATLRHGDAQVQIFRSVLTAVAQKLVEKQYLLKSQSTSVESLKKALAEFQKANGLPQTHLPDPITINTLLR